LLYFIQDDLHVGYVVNSWEYLDTIMENYGKKHGLRL